MPAMSFTPIPRSASSTRWRRSPWCWIAPWPVFHGLEAFSMAAMASALAVVGLACWLVPQRLAQRPASAGVISLHLAHDGSLRLWNQPIASQALQGLLRRAQQRSDTIRIRVLPEPGVPWGVVQTLVERLDGPQRQVELQLP